MIINPYLYTSTPSIVTTSLRLHLDAGNSSSYPGTGTTWTDLTGNGYNATLSGGVTYSSSNGGILIYDGVDDVATSSLSKTALANVSGKWTIQFWVYISGSQTSVGVFQMADGLNSANPWLLLQRQNDTTIRWYVNGSYRITNTITTNTWYNLAISYDGTTVKFFTNGVQESTTYVGGLGGNGGASTYLANGFNGNLNGRMPHILAYTTDLTQSQLQQNFDAIKSRYI